MDMSTEKLPQLMMRRPNLDDLPPLVLPDGLTLREMTLDDLPGLAAVMAAAFDDGWTVETTRARLFDDSSVRETFGVLDGDGNVLATASVRLDPTGDPDDAYVHWVGASPARAGQGLGRLATLATLYAMRGHGRPRAALTTDDFRRPAIRSYLRLGFEPVCWHESHAGRWATILAELEKA